MKLIYVSSARGWILIKLGVVLSLKVLTETLLVQIHIIPDLRLSIHICKRIIEIKSRLKCAAKVPKEQGKITPNDDTCGLHNIW